MLVSGSISQPIVHSNYLSQQNLAESKPSASDLEKKDNDTVRTEADKLTKKATAELSREDQQKIQQLKQRDLEVKAHEQAHLNAAGSIAIGGASFTYQTGPNGVRYAVGGEVSIDTSVVDGDPAATLRKADAIRRAALAPANPSAQDQRVAGNATTMSKQARVDLVELTQELQKESEITEKEQPNQTEEDSKIESQAIEKPSQPSIPGALLDISV